MLTALLAALVTWCLLVGAMPAPLPLLAGAALGLVLLLSGHHHGAVQMLDTLARRSRFAGVHPAVKTAGCTGLLCLCLLCRTPWPPLVLFAVLAVLVCAGGVRPHMYWSVLAIPAAFLFVSALALLWQYSPVPEGMINLPLGSGYLVLTVASQITARLVTARALGALGCLYFLSLTTPMPEVLSVLRRIHMPDVVMDLAVLIYRYIFLLLATWEDMRAAAASRLGFGGWKRSVRTTGILYGNLLARSFRRAQACFDAMESRCCTGSIRFSTRPKPVRPLPVAGFGLLWLGMALALMCGG